MGFYNFSKIFNVLKIFFRTFFLLIPVKCMFLFSFSANCSSANVAEILDWLIGLCQLILPFLFCKFQNYVWEQQMLHKMKRSSKSPIFCWNHPKIYVLENQRRYGLQLHHYMRPYGSMSHTWENERIEIIVIVHIKDCLKQCNNNNWRGVV